MEARVHIREARARGSLSAIVLARFGLRSDSAFGMISRTSNTKERARMRMNEGDRWRGRILVGVLAGCATVTVRRRGS